MMDTSTTRYEVAGSSGVLDWPIVLTSLLLAAPVSLGVYRGYEFNPAFALTPFIAAVYFMSLRNNLNLTFAAAATGGVVSIFFGHLMEPGNLPGNIEGLLFGTLFAPSFMFLGRYLAERKGLRPLVVWLAFFSTVFLIVIISPLLLTGEQVRGIDENGYSFINVSLLGIPIYASYGVNSLAPLFAIQQAIICGAFISSNQYFRVIFALGLAAATYLIVGAESRGAQLGALIIVPAVFWYWLRHTFARPVAAIAIIIIFSSATAALVLESGNSRLASSVAHVSKSAVASILGAEQSPGTPAKDGAIGVTTGRTLIWQTAFKEWQEHPFIGVSFAGFGRYNDGIPAAVSENTTAHLYYLNLLWKGGLIFMVPFALMMFLAFRRAINGQPYQSSPVRFFTGTAVLATFTLPSFFWDVLIIPSAGAMAWLLLGALGASRRIGMKP